MKDLHEIQFPAALVYPDGPAELQVCESDIPLDALSQNGPAVLALITAVDGAAYRPAGAAMVVLADGTRIGSLSSGCLERDVVLHARTAIQTGHARKLRYGRGSPFGDITLPCGGGFEILLIPHPCPKAVSAAMAQLALRQTSAIYISKGGMLVSEPALAHLTLRLRPQPRFLVFGKGPEAIGFARLASQAGYPTELFSPDADILEASGFGRHLPGLNWPTDVMIDAHSAVTLFFHDHDHEPQILLHSLRSLAFYVGAQGSLKAHNLRYSALLELGASAADCVRLATPFGLIPSTRDARTLAVSVLAQILERRMQLLRAV